MLVRSFVISSVLIAAVALVVTIISISADHKNDPVLSGEDIAQIASFVNDLGEQYPAIRELFKELNNTVKRDAEISPPVISVAPTEELARERLQSEVADLRNEHQQLDALLQDKRGALTLVLREMKKGSDAAHRWDWPLAFAVGVVSSLTANWIWVRFRR